MAHELNLNFKIEGAEELHAKLVRVRNIYDNINELIKEFEKESKELGEIKFSLKADKNNEPYFSRLHNDLTTK